MALKLLTPAFVLALLAGAANAQSTLGELLDKGGQKVSKADTIGMLPSSFKYQWPQGGGEGDLVFHANGTLSGTEYHYPSRSESPATGSWTLDDNGRWCVKKSMAAWNTKTDLCWFLLRVGDDYFMGPSDSDRAARVSRIKSIAKL